jgi:hypothetical protein
MAVRIECDDCGNLIYQIRIIEKSEATALAKEKSHDRCFSCLLAYVAELTERTISFECIDAVLDISKEGKVC